jgi:hypothetical protein
MTLRTFIHSSAKRAETLALLNSGATENFLNLDYAKYLHLPIKKFDQPRKLYNVDAMENQAGELQFYTDLSVQTGTKCIMMRFMLSNLGEQKAILGYLWFAAVQPQIDWSQGWIKHKQLPIVIRSPDAQQAQFTRRTKTILAQRHHHNQTIHICSIEDETPEQVKAKIPVQYHQYWKVFSDCQAQ